MREILFKGKRLDNGEWVYGDLVTNLGHTFIKLVGTDHLMYLGKNNEYVTALIPVYPATVGQYTGLKDTNGVKIFEGDIVEYDDTPYSPYAVKIKGVVKFEKSKWVIDCKSKYGSSFPFGADDFFSKKTRIVSNPENPELLEEVK